ncbi:MAG: gliding motility-associated C-terminal domain-containing protein [Flavobacteriales bacterium]|nr:gliding motility-associated C-terminal domain-containing protein [Flavobacteriales bacterium]
MKNRLLHIVCVWALSVTNVLAQCANNNSFLTDLTPTSCPGSTTNTCVQGGQYVSVNVVAGNTYTFSTCGDTDFDTQLTLYNGATSVGYNDDGCGLQSTITWIATYTGSLNVLVDQYPCSNNAGCMTLDISCTPQAGSCVGGPVCTGAAADVCATACSLGTLNAPNACPNGTGTAQSWCGSNIGATAANPYQYQLSCSGGGDMPTFVPEVWYTFVPQGNSVVIDVNGLINPSIGLWDGDCAGLAGIGCANGSGSASLLVEPVIPGNTYYLQISGGDPTDVDDFELSITNQFNCDICLTEASVSVDPPPTNGFYQNGTEVTFCYTIDTWVQQNINWLHGVQVSFGAGWDQSTLSTVPAASQDGWGTWSWYNTPITSSIPSNGTFPPGFYYESALDDDFNNSGTNPGDNYGDNATGGWEFCWTITSTDCPPGIDGMDLGINVTTTADGESGDWTSIACSPDPSVVTNAILTCCPEPILQNLVNNPCSSDCVGSATVIGDGTGPYNYSWVQDSNGSVVHSENGVSGASTATGLCAGNYTVIVTDLFNGCTADLQVTISEPTPVVGALDATTDADCNAAATGSATVSASGGTPPYTFDIGSGPQVSGTFTALAAGSYTVNILDANNCPTSVPVVIAEPAVLVLSQDAVTDATCGNANGAFTVSATGGTTPYSFDIGSGPQASGTFTALTAGSYTITVTDANNCTDDMVVTIADLSGLTASISSQTDADCFGAATGAVTVEASGSTAPYSYAIDGVTFGASGTFTGLTAGSYTITAQDANNCTFPVPVTIAEPTPVVGALDATVDADCNAAATGSATVSASGGTPPYSFDIGSGPQVSGTFTALAAGSYTVTILDANNCSDVVPISISEPTPVVGALDATTDADCNAAATGSATVSASGGTPPYTFDIGSGPQVSGTFTALAAGSYTVNILDANNCPTSVPVVIAEPAVLVLSQDAVTDATCGNANGAFTVSATGGTTPYSFDIGSGPQASGTFTALTAGSYTITVTDANNCTDDMVVTIADLSGLTASISSQTDADCFGAATGAVTVEASGSTAPYSYAIDGVTFGASGTFTGLTAGSYTITAQDANNCTFPVPVTIAEPTPVVGALDATVDADCNAAATGSATVSASGGTPPYTFDIGSGPQVSGTFTALAAGSYTVTILDANNCSDVVTISISEPTPVVGALDATTDADCNAAATGSATVSASGGTPPYSFDIGSGPQASGTFTGLAAGSYTVNILDANNCPTSVPVVIAEPAVLVLSQDAVTDATCGNANGAFTVSATGGTTPYSFDIGSGPQASGTFTALTAGSYTITVTDANNCTDDMVVTIADLSGLTASISSQTDADCFGAATGAVTVEASGSTAPYSYAIDGVTFGASGTFTGLTAGSYTITAQDANNCTFPVPVTIAEPTPVVGALDATVDADCNAAATGSATVSASGGTPPYTFDIGSGPQVSGTFTALAAGSYTVTILDANNCSDVVTISISEPTPVVGALDATTDADCNAAATGSATVSASGGTPPYSFDIGSGPQASGTFTGLAAGSYTVNILDANNCPTSVPVVIAEPAVLVLSQDAVTDATCGNANGAFTVSATGGTTPYSFDIGSGPQASGTFTALTAGSYTVTVTDANNCTDDIVVTIADLSGLTASITSQTDADCFGAATGSVTVEASGSTAPYSYAIDGVTFGASGTFTGLSAGSYTITAQDANNCTFPVPVTIAEPTPVVGALDATVDADCNAAATGSATVSASGGTPPYTFDIGSGPQVSGTFTALAAGSYTVTILDANNCSDVVTISISEPTPVVGAIQSQTDPTCFGGSDGVFTISATGGTPNYSYTDGAGNQTNGTFAGYSAGTYTVDVTDANGCLNTVSIILNEPTEVIGTVDNQTDASCSGMADATVEVSAVGGTSPYTFDIGNGAQNSGSFATLTAGSYTIVVEDAVGCQNTIAVTLLEPISLTASIVNQTAVSCFGGTDGSVEIAAQDGTGPYSYDIGNGPQQSGTFSNLSAGNYSVTVADANGCSVQVVIDITEPTELAASIASQLDLTCFGSNDGQFEVGASGGTPPYTFDIGGGSQPTGVFDNLLPNTYTVAIEDANLCQTTIDITISEPAPLVIDAGNDVTICDGDVIGLSASGAVSYSWIPAQDLTDPNISNPDFNGSATTTLTVTGTDADGCIATDDVTVTVNPLPVVDAGADEVICTGFTVQLDASGAVSYVWSAATNLDDANIQSPTFSGTNTETLTVTGTDGNGCVNTDDVTVTVNDLPIVDAGPNLETCEGSTVQLQASGGVSYSWGPQNGLNNYAVSNPVFSGLNTTTYTVTSIDGNGCTASDQITITVNAILPVDAGPDTAICFGEMVQLAAMGAQSYEWSPATGLDNANVPDPVFSGTTTTTFTVVGTDANGCTNTDDITVSVNLLPSVDAGMDEALCVGGQVQLVATGALNYEWSPSIDLDNAQIANPVFSGTATALLTVVGTDQNGCSSTDDVNVTVNPLPVVDAGQDLAICSGFSIQLGATGATTYDWNPAVDLDNGSIANPTFSGLTTTTFTVTGTDGNGCINTDVVEVTVNNLPVADAGPDAEICDGESTQLNASGAVSFSWNPITGLDNPAIANPTFSGSTTTLFTVTVTDASGCESTDDVEVTVHDLPAVDAGIDEAICIGDQAQLSVSGATTYVWSPSTYLDNSTSDSPIFSGTSTTLFTVTGTDLNGCVNVDDVNITVNALPVVDAGTDEAICFGEDIQLAATGATDYVWTPSTDLTNGSISNPVFNGGNTTTLTVTGTDLNGCVNTDDVTITVNQLPAINAGPDQAICEGESAQLEAIGTGSFVWFPGGSLSSPTISNPVATPSATEEYVVHLTDAAGCLNTDTVTVTVMLNPTALILANAEACEAETISFESASLGNIVSTVWVLGDGNTESVSNFDHQYPTEGTYQVTLAVTTDEGCSDATSVSIEIHPNPIANYDFVNICLDAPASMQDQSIVSTGTIDQWEWDFGDGESSTLQNPQHTYPVEGTFTVELVVETNFGCTDTISSDIAVHPMPSSDFTVGNACADGLASVTDNSTITTGTIDQWMWVVDVTDTVYGQSPMLGSLPVGLYPVELTVTSDYGCENTSYADIEIYPLPVAMFTADSVCLGLPTQFTDLSTESINYPISSWEWTFDGGTSTDQNATNIYASFGSNYAQLIVTNTAGCDDTISTNDILVHPNPVADFSIESHFCEEDSVYFFDQSTVVQSTDDEIVDWQWTFATYGTRSDQSPTFVFDEFGAHEISLVVATNNGCFHADTQTIQINPLPNPVIAADQFEGCQILPVQFWSESTIEPGYYLDNWAWTFGDGTDTVFAQHPGHDFLGAEPGDTSTYYYDVSLTVTSADGCVATVTEPQLITVYANPTALYEANFYITDLNDPVFDFTDQSSENVVDWYWEFGDGDYTDEQNPSHTYADTGTYAVSLLVSTIHGCTASIRDFVVVNPVFTFYIPNSFTPNGDGINDFFFGQGMGYKEYHFSVYNRWGEEIFESHDDEYHWDGSFKGQQVQQGTYVYRFEIIDWQNHLHIYTDGVTLHR